MVCGFVVYPLIHVRQSKGNHAQSVIVTLNITIFSFSFKGYLGDSKNLTINGGGVTFKNLT